MHQRFIIRFRGDFVFLSRSLYWSSKIYTSNDTLFASLNIIAIFCFAFFFFCFFTWFHYRILYRKKNRFIFYRIFICRSMLSSHTHPTHTKMPFLLIKLTKCVCCTCTKCKYLPELATNRQQTPEQQQQPFVLRVAFPFCTISKEDKKKTNTSERWNVLQQPNKLRWWIECCCCWFFFRFTNLFDVHFSSHWSHVITTSGIRTNRFVRQR